MPSTARSPDDLAQTLASVLAQLPESRAVLGALARTIRANIPQSREHPSHEVFVDDWAHAYALGQNRRLNHPLKQAVLTVARRIDDAGLGRLRLGRRGKKTRFSLPPAELHAWLEVMTESARLAPDPRPEPPPRPIEPSTHYEDEAHEAGSADTTVANDSTGDAPTPPRAAPLEARPRPGPPEPHPDRTQSPPPPSPRVRIASPAAPIRHRFVIRPGYAVEFDLPEDFSPAEAKRLTQFITALPFDGWTDD